MPITLNNSNIRIQYNTGSNYIIETVKSDLYTRDLRSGISSNLTSEPTISPSINNNNIAIFRHNGGTEDQTMHNIYFPVNTVCDILIIGGGGGGGRGQGGGGGAGQLVFINQATLNGTYIIKVGKGGYGGKRQGNMYPYKGKNSEFGNNSINIIAEGGGANNTSLSKDGGSGAGGDPASGDTGSAGKGIKSSIVDIFPSGTVYSKGNDGGLSTSGSGQGGGGGGAGAAGGNGAGYNAIADNGGNGLSGITEIGYDFKSNFGNIGQLESDGNYWFAGGGSGGLYLDPGPGTSKGGKGGGGSARSSGGIGIQGQDAINHTGSGGGGGSAWNGNGGNGGSGIVIIKIRESVNYKYLTINYEEKMYPPIRNFTSATTTISGQAYGNGTYIVSYSSSYSGLEPFKCFNISDVYGGHWQGGKYNSSNGEYIITNTGTESFDGGNYKGEWIKIKLPIAIKLTKYSFKQRSDILSRAPLFYRIYGSNDDINWNLLIDKTESFNIITYYDLLYTDNSFDISEKYNYFVLVVKKLVGNADVLNFDEWYIYGYEESTFTLNFNNQTICNIQNITDKLLLYSYVLKINTPISSITPSINDRYNLNSTSISTKSCLVISYHLLNPVKMIEGAQWTYNSSNINVYHMGNVGIGTTIPEYSLDVRGFIYSSSGGYTSSSLTKWSVLSDRRIKENIVKASYDKCLENVKNIELYNFNFKDNCINTNDRHQLGFIAQEVQNIYPKAVEVNQIILNLEEKIDNLLTLNTTQIDYTLYGAVKHLIEKIENIKIKMEKIKNIYNITI